VRACPSRGSQEFIEGALQPTALSHRDAGVGEQAHEPVQQPAFPFKAEVREGALPRPVQKVHRGPMRVTRRPLPGVVRASTFLPATLVVTAQATTSGQLIGLQRLDRCIDPTEKVFELGFTGARHQ
jgi:hypothetical protein